MIIQAKNKVWDRKYHAAKNEREINELMLRSGKETAVHRINFQTGDEFFRPAVGKFVIHGLTAKDDFRYNTVSAAIIKGKEIRQIIINELAVSLNAL